MPPQPWYVRTYNQDYLDIYGAHLDARTVVELESILKSTELAAGARILDLACGHGRHAIPLALQGFHVTGLDLSPLFLRRARQQAHSANAKVRWKSGDIRQLPFRGEFEAVLSLYNAYGFFEDENDNLHVLEGVVRALCPRGVFFLDLLGLQPINTQTGSSQAERPGYKLEETVAFNPTAKRLAIDQTITRPGSPPRHLHHNLRLFEPAEIRHSLESVGLEVLSQWGGFDGCSTEQGDRLITIARKS